VPFTAEIRFKYSMPLPPPTLEEQLALYQWHGANNKWIIEENTVVDVDKDFVWSKVTHFCELCIGNSNLQYSDNDGLCDWYERNTYHPNFSDDLAYLNGKTNELIDDTDGDGLWDGWGDLNGDGIFNGGETKGEVQYYTSPLNADTDDDNVPDDLDMDPLVDLTITVKITEILALDDVDDDILGNHNPADFYLWISCSNGQIAKLPDLADRDYFEENNDHVHPDSSAMFDAADDVEIIGFNIMLYDDDGGVEETYEDTLASGDDLCDLNYKQGTGGSWYILQINYNLKTGQWGMDDYPCDPNGYGHVSGEEDLYDGDQDDCELWFDITQNDYDADGLTWWQECGPDNPDRYGTDPTDWDTDGDGLNDYDEIIVYGINPIDSDIDDDGILDGMDLFMPPEWGLKSEVIITWPYIAPSMFPMTKDIIREAVIALNGKGVVRINIPDSAMEAMAKHILTNGPNSISIEAFDNGLIDFFSNPSGGGLWVRDYGPQFVINKNDNRVTVVDWKYGSSSYNPYPQDYYNEFHTVFGLDYINAEDIILDGGAFQTDGNGYGYVYGSYLTEFEKGILKNIHGLKEIREVPTFNSGTNHIDMYVYIASPTTVIIADFINGPVVDDNQVEAAIVAFESWGFEVIRLATPPPSPYYFAYTNALVINDRVLVPTYNMPWWDENAISVFQNAFPLKKIVPIHAETGLQYSGAVHCAAITKPLMP
jgi:agmatine deiminase